MYLQTCIGSPDIRLDVVFAKLCNIIIFNYARYIAVMVPVEPYQTWTISKKSYGSSGTISCILWFQWNHIKYDIVPVEPYISYDYIGLSLGSTGTIWSVLWFQWNHILAIIISDYIWFQWNHINHRMVLVEPYRTLYGSSRTIWKL